MPTVYLAGPIKGLSYSDVVGWRDIITTSLAHFKINTTSPMRNKEYLQGTGVLDAAYEQHILSTQKSIMTRDFFDCTHADMVVVNLLGYSGVSIGTIMEIAWAYEKRIPVVCIIEDGGNLHDHPMVREAISYRVRNIEDAIMIVKSVLVPYAK
jgi:nucleoside 2-deoxyribosyltransferase